MAQWLCGSVAQWLCGSVAQWLCGRVSDFQSKGPGFESTCCHFETLAISFAPLCPCLSKETLKAFNPFYLMSMPGKVKDPTQGNGKKTCHGDMDQELVSRSINSLLPLNFSSHQVYSIVKTKCNSNSGFNNLCSSCLTLRLTRQEIHTEVILLLSIRKTGSNTVKLDYAKDARH